ncbi:MAG: ferredoxin-type protein NapG [Pseudomonadota bacterium]
MSQQQSTDNGQKLKQESKSKKIHRRQFLGDTLKTVCGIGLLGMGLGSYSRQASSFPAWAVRPPGAINEEDFSGACIRCGLCVRDCPYDTLKLAELGDQIETGTPYFIARDIPCEMCDDIPCVVACPTSALDHDLTVIEDSRMGLAVVVDHETCIAFLGLRCEVCFNVCPVQGKAITLDMRHNRRSGKHAEFIPVVHSDACTGCGKCEYACILEEAAIRIFPTAMAKGKVGEHYRLGWKEKQAKGESLVTPDVEHQYNLPEGVRYDYNQGGLKLQELDNKSADASPFSGNPLDTLKNLQMQQKD